jgi:hypothetical protein
MLGFTRVFIGMTAILAIGMAAVIALPEARVTARQFDADWTWAPFRAGGGDYRTPLGWSATDAYSTSTRHAALTLTEPICPLSAQVAYFKSEASDRELYLMFGTATEMEIITATAQRTLDSFAATSGRKQGDVRLADGTMLRWSTTRVALGAGEGREMVYFVGVAEKNGKQFIASGGAKARVFDLEEFAAFLRSVTLPS